MPNFKCDVFLPRSINFHVDLRLQFIPEDPSAPELKIEAILGGITESITWALDFLIQKNIEIEERNKQKQEKHRSELQAYDRVFAPVLIAAEEREKAAREVEQEEEERPREQEEQELKEEARENSKAPPEERPAAPPAPLEAFLKALTLLVKAPYLESTGVAREDFKRALIMTLERDHVGIPLPSDFQMRPQDKYVLEPGILRPQGEEEQYPSRYVMSMVLSMSST